MMKLTLPAQTAAPLLTTALEMCPVGIVIEDENGHIVEGNNLGRSLLSPATDFLPATMREHQSNVKYAERLFTLKTFIPDLEPGCVRELLQLAYIDHLTGLPNGRLMAERVSSQIDSNPEQPFGLAFIDLNNFKEVNDYYGHTVGDILLQKAATRILACLREADMAARVGGDEFVLLVTPADSEATLRALACSVGDKLKQPYFIDGHEILASGSIGLSYYPSHGNDFDTLRRKADDAMYRGKRRAKGGVEIYDVGSDQQLNSRMMVEQRLRLAIRDGRVCCAYQPKVELSTGIVTGVEVLLRWMDEDGFMQAPGDFVSLAVELGLINEIAYRVLTEVVRSIPIIDETYGQNTSVSLNIAAKQASDFSFMADFVEAISATGVGGRFVLELTEEAFYAKSLIQSQIIPMIREAGIRVSIDDFGVGYSSLGALSELEVDEVKLDRSFISDIQSRPRSQAVVRAVEQVCKDLGISLVAEGIETEHEVDFLRKHTTIECGQGYFFGRPKALDETASDVLRQRIHHSDRSENKPRERFSRERTRY